MKTKNRKKTAVITASLATLLLATGTFAWTSISQQALNEKGATLKSGGRIHDDYFVGDTDNPDEVNDGNKDIYAENFGEQNLIVRIKLSEYMENNGTPLAGNLTTIKKDDKSTWIPYGLPQSAESQKLREYVTWDLGGKKTFLPTFNKDNDEANTTANPESLVPDASGDAQAWNGNSYVIGNAAGSGKQEHFISGKEYDIKGVEVPPSAAGTGHVAKETLTQESVPLSMAEWVANGSKTGKYWVIDTDGWAYWAEMLAPGDATSLLLTHLIYEDAVGNLDTFYYGIDVFGEFATKSDVSKFDDSGRGAPSTAAKALLKKISPTIGGYDPSKPSDPFEVEIGQTFKFDGKDYIYLKDMGDNRRLILSKQTIGNEFSTATYNGSKLDKKMREHYESLSDEAKAEVQPVQKVFEVGTPMDGNMIGIDNIRFLVSNPFDDRTKVTEGEAGEKKAFALSMADINDVSGNEPGKAFKKIAERVAKDPYGNDTTWLTRSPFSTDKWWDLSAGAWDINEARLARGARPGFIINR